MKTAFVIVVFIAALIMIGYGGDLSSRGIIVSKAGYLICSLGFLLLACLVAYMIMSS